MRKTTLALALGAAAALAGGGLLAAPGSAEKPAAQAPAAHPPRGRRSPARP